MLEYLRKNKTVVVILSALFLGTSGCGIINTIRYSGIIYERNYPDLSSRKGKGVFHTVKKGETIYRIAKTYGISPYYLQRVNRISHPERIPLGYKLWIPGAKRKLTVKVYHKRRREKKHFYAHLSKKHRNKRVFHQMPVTKKLLWPVEGGVITSKFGIRGNRKHDGVDIGAPKGRDIYAAKAGKVLFSGYGPTGYGKLVILKHNNRLVTVYAHCSRILVRKGQIVRAGQVIAKVGSTGRSTGPHLHFEVRIDRKPRNPLKYIPSSSTIGLRYAKR